MFSQVFVYPQGVDISGPVSFSEVNVSGTRSLLEAEYFRLGVGMSRGGYVQGMGTHPLWNGTSGTMVGTVSPWTSDTTGYDW